MNQVGENKNEGYQRDLSQGAMKSLDINAADGEWTQKIKWKSLVG